MSIADRRAANRRRVAIDAAVPRPAGSIRADGLTGADVLEIWARTGKVGGPVPTKTGDGWQSRKHKLRLGNGR